MELIISLVKAENGFFIRFQTEEGIGMYVATNATELGKTVGSAVKEWVKEKPVAQED